MFDESDYYGGKNDRRPDKEQIYVPPVPAFS